MIRCIIFDCDGTLVDSEYLCNSAMEGELKAIGLSLSAEYLVSRFRGMKLDTILSMIEQEYLVTLPPDFVDKYRQRVNDLFLSDLQPCSGVHTALGEIDLPMCVASSGPTQKIENALSITQLAKYFERNIFSAYDIGKWKPEPDLFLHAADSMGFEPTNCAVVEDSLVGIEAAISAGMLPILYDPSGTMGCLDGVLKIRCMSELVGIVKAISNTPL
ncbi:HAD-IA family hydrolase [Vibrio coralliilyticus]|uniref:HAD-IA family hydrolase n=1 Tax=Vibrio coralliilyticus TaxID=190893 RepID=UPI002FD0B989